MASLFCSGTTLLLHFRQHQGRASVIRCSSYSSSSARVSTSKTDLPPPPSSRVSTSQSENSSSSSSSSSLDISDYLLAKQDWRKTPKCPDYIGPICIKKTPDGRRGRGVYATREIPKGELLMVGNPIASAHNDTDSVELFARICDVIKRDPAARRRFFLLSGRETEHPEVPPIELFDPAIPMNPVSHAPSPPKPKNSSSQKDPTVPMSSHMRPPMDNESTNPQDQTGPMVSHTSATINDDIECTSDHISFDYKHVHDIMRLNSFQAKLYSSDGHPSIKVSGMYLLPAMMNHSCLRNASRMFVGEAMVFYAARDIQINEEITVEYCDGLLPLMMREALLGSRFQCQCPRCEVERSVAPYLQDYSELFVTLYAEAYEELRDMLTTGRRTSFPASEQLANAYEGVRKKTNTFNHLTKLQKQWILAGFSSAFLANWFRMGHSTGFAQPSQFVTPVALELLDAMMVSVPGVEHTLTFAMMLSLVAQREDFQLSSRLFDKAKDECVATYGKQRDDVITALAMRAAQRAPF